ncbi:MAG: four helix bundle protein [bacterium]
MVRIQKFEDLDAWREARKLVALIYKHVSLGGFKKDYALRDQIVRAAISTMANIAEGFDAGSNAQFIFFLIYAKRSASEVQSHLYVALDNLYLLQSDFENAYQQAETVRKITQGLINYLKRSNSQQSTGNRQLVTSNKQQATEKEGGF